MENLQYFDSGQYFIGDSPMNLLYRFFLQHSLFTKMKLYSTIIVKH